MCFLCISFTRSGDGTVLLFQTGRQRPISSTGHISSSISPATIKVANEAVRQSAFTPTLMDTVNSLR